MRYVVGIFNYADGDDLELIAVYGNSPYDAVLEAVLQYADKEDYLLQELKNRKTDEFPDTIGALLDWYWDQDLIINYKEIKNGY